MRLSLLPLSAALLLASGSASADFIAIGSAEAWSGGSYFGAGGIASLPGSRLGSGWGMKAWADRNEYEYLGSAGTVRGVAVGEEISVGRMATGASWSAAGWVGLAHRDTDLSPSDPSNSAEGSQTSAKLQGDLSLDMGPARLEAIASAHPALDSYWGRLRLGTPVSERARAGLEATWGGDPGYDARTFGAFASWRLDDALTLGLKGGWRDSDESGGYFGLEASYYWP